MLTVLVGVFLLFGSVVDWLFFTLSSFLWVIFSLVGEDEELDCCCETIHDFLRSLVRDRAGEPPGESVCLTVSVRPRSAFLSGLGSADGSLLLLEKGRNLVERRELLGLKCTPAVSGASSEEGLDPPEELSEVLPPLTVLSASSSPKSGWRSFTRGK